MTQPLQDDPIAAEVERRLRELRQDPETLLARFDRNGDGVLDAEEWRVARDTVQREIVAEQPGEIEVERIAGRFRLVTRLGRGSQGTTYLAIDETTDEFVALKDIDLAAVKGWDSTERFEREAAILGGLSHPQIPRLLDTIRIDADAPRLVMVQQFVEGSTLATRLRDGELFDEERLLDIARQLLEVVGYLHRQTPPVIHRDIKPDNLILSEDGTLYLVDFGAAQGAEDRQAVGTNGYMAPEQLIGDAVPASDVYGIGATLIHLATRKHPSSMLQGLELVWTQYASISEPTTAWLNQMVAPYTEDRFRNALVTARDLPQNSGGSATALAPTESGGALATTTLVKDLNRSRPDGCRYMARAEGDAVVLEIPPQGLVNEQTLYAGVLAIAVGIYLASRPGPMDIYMWGLLGTLIVGTVIFEAVRNPIQKIRIDSRGLSLARKRGTRQQRIPGHHVLEAKLTGSHNDQRVVIRTSKPETIALAHVMNSEAAEWLRRAVEQSLEERRLRRIAESTRKR